MGSNDAIKVKRNDDAVWRVIDGEVVVLAPQQATIHALKGCGSRVWELIEGGMAISEIIKRICAEYEVEPQIAKEEITQFVHKLEGMKLVSVIPVAGEEPSR